MRLKNVKNDTEGHGYCGPIAISALTGRRMSVILNTFREVWYGPKWRSALKQTYGYRYRPFVKGTSTGSVRGVLHNLGWKMISVNVPHPISVERFATLFAGRDCYLIEVQNHWVAISKTQACDTSTSGKVVSMRKFKYRNDPVIRAHCVVRV